MCEFDIEANVKEQDEHGVLMGIRVRRHPGFELTADEYVLGSISGSSPEILEALARTQLAIKIEGLAAQLREAPPSWSE